MAKRRNSGSGPPPDVAADAPAPPPGLSAEAVDRWRVVVAEASRRKHRLDLDLLKTYCQVWARWRWSEDTIEKTGILVKRGKDGRAAASPLIAVARQAAADVRNLERRLGIDSEAEPTAASQLVTRHGLASLFKVTAGTITRWERDGMPVAKRAPRGQHSLFDVEAVRAWRQSVEASTDGNASTSLTTSRAQLADAQRIKVELDIAARRGELVSREQVIREGQAHVKGWTAMLRSLPRRAAQLGILEAAQVPALEALVRDVLTEISSWRTAADARAAEKKLG